MAKNDKFLSRDRMRYTKNSLSSTLSYVAILFNVLYFITLYHSDVGNYYYNMTIGFSVVYNLLFLLFTFLASEGVKNYSNRYSLLLIGLGIMQVVRIFEMPLDAYNATIKVVGEEVRVMDESQFITIAVFLSLSALAAVAAGLVGLYKTAALRRHIKKTQANK